MVFSGEVESFSSTFGAHSAKKKDTPFFAFLLDILHSGQSGGHTSEELGGRRRCSVSPSLLWLSHFPPSLPP